MRHRYMVIDQNVLREPELAELVNTQPWVRFVLPDLSFIEITKTTGSQESTLQPSLQSLASVPERRHSSTWKQLKQPPLEPG
jgi:hypothetical protein